MISQRGHYIAQQVTDWTKAAQRTVLMLNISSHKPHQPLEMFRSNVTVDQYNVSLWS